MHRGRKARDCSGPGWSILTDITPIVECKPVPGATMFLFEKLIGNSKYLMFTILPGATMFN